MTAACNPKGETSPKPAILALLALGLAGLAGASMAQMLPEAIDAIEAVPSDRLCTAGFNTDYGWFDVTSSGLGVLEFPGQLASSSCTKATAAGLAVQLGGVTLPLAGEAKYNLAVTPPTLTVSLLEPALCEDYYSNADGSTSWALAVKDANNETVHFGVGLNTQTMAGVTSLNYVLANSALQPKRATTDIEWLRCHAGLAPNALPPITGPGTVDYIFADSIEPSMADLRVEFVDVQDDVLGQSTTGDVEFKVRVSNRGTAAAQNVRIREFVPTATVLMGPTVSRISCYDHGAGAACNSGSGSTPFAEVIGTLNAGAQREYTLKRKSSGTDTSASQSMALIQVAAFSDPGASPDSNYADNSRSLRIKVLDQISITRAATAGGTITRVSAPTGCSAEVGAVTTCPPGTTGLVYSATANSGYTFTGFTGCAGTASGVSETGGTLSTTSTSSCTLTANFQGMPTVTATHGSNGTISPASQQVHYNTPAQFTVTPATGFDVDVISGCGGISHVSGQTWQSAPVTANCAVNVTFKTAQYTVTATAIGNGTVTPGSASVQHGQPVSFAVNPATNHQVTDVTSTCPSFPGGWFGNVYLLTDVTEDCSVTFQFELITHNVMVSEAIQNGTIKFLDANGNELPGADIDVPHGESVRFKPVADQGFTFSGSPTAVSAVNCSLQSLSYDFALQAYVGVTQPITADNCILSATFMPE